MKCAICKGNMKKIKDAIQEDGVEFEAYKCTKCGEELMNMSQLKSLANKYRKLKKSKEITFAKWGNSIAVRIPSDYAEEFKIHPGKHGLLTKDEKGIRILPS